MKKLRDKPWQFLTCILVLVLLLSAPVYADVGDNLNGWLIDFLGYGKQDTVPSTYGGSLVERVNFLENENQFLKDQIASLGTKADNLATKEDVENVSKAANASYNLYVYIPKDVATGNYDGQKVTITSSSGNQNSTAILRDDGKNYSTTLYFNFSGNCKLNFDMLCNSIVNGVQLPVTISATGQEQKLWNKGEFSDQYSWDFVHEICSSNKANQIFNAGDKLKNGWSIVNTSASEIKIWNKSIPNLGNMAWGSANSTAGNYATTWNNSNSGLPVIASRSELLSKSEAETMSQGDRTTGFDYWTSTGNSRGNHWSVNSDGSLTSNNDSNSYGCCPGIWIR